MKKFIIIPLISILTIISLAAVFNFNSQNNNSPSSSSSRDVVLQFITYNGYGNNLYLDNVLTGIQPDNDIMVSSIVNITYDTTYAFFTNGSDTISPQVAVSNIGRNAAADINRPQCRAACFRGRQVPAAPATKVSGGPIRRDPSRVGASISITKATSSSRPGSRSTATAHRFG